MARPIKAAAGDPGLREYLIATFRGRCGPGREWAYKMYGLYIERLESGQPMELDGYLLGDLRPAGIDVWDRVRLEPDESLTVLQPRGVD